METKTEELTIQEQIKQNFIFHHNDVNTSTDSYICKCGHINVNASKDNEVKLEINYNSEEDLDLEDIAKGRNIINLKCSNCDLDFSTKANASLIQETDEYFLENFNFVEDTTSIILTKIRFAGAYIQWHDTGDKTLEIKEITSYIKLDKATKKILFKDYNSEETEINLDRIMSVSKKFFQNDGAKITDKLFDVHSFLGRLANFVSDSQTINFIDDLMSQIKGRAGIPILIKTMSIFLGIVCYSNLSTIALTKGSLFLFDLLNDCQLPIPSVLSDSKATSPIKIFNLLVNIKNKEIQKDLDLDNHEKAGYLFKSTKGEVNIRYDASRFENTIDQISKIKGEVFVRDEIENIKISSFIYDKLNSFSDYKSLIKYLKFIKYNDIITLVMKYDMELLIKLINMIEFRTLVDLPRIEQFLSLIISHIKTSQRFAFEGKIRSINPFTEKAEFLNVNEDNLKFVRNTRKTITEGDHTDTPKNIEVQPIEIKTIPVYIEPATLDYKYMDYFDFTSYDDSMRMLAVLIWDPNKEFYKIKDVLELESYHDKLLDHFNLLSNKDKNKLFVDFVSNFKYLEEYDGDLKVRLVKTPEELLKLAKDLKSCAGSYVSRISHGQYVIFMVTDISPEIVKGEDDYFMLGVYVTKNGLDFDQVKATCNHQGTDRFKKQIMKYLEAKDISYKELADLKLTGNIKSGSDMAELFDFRRNMNGAENV